MTLGPTFLLLAAGSALLLGFVADVLARKLGLPDVIWLMFLGILFGPVVKIISFNDVITFAPYIGVAALSLILFDAGMDMRSHVLGKITLQAVLLALASVMMAMGVLLPISYYFITGGNYIPALVFAAALSCTSSGVVVAVASRMSIATSIRALVHLTTAVEDSIAIIIVTVLLLLVAPSTSLFGIGTFVFYAALYLPIGIIGGLIAGIFWIEVSAKFQSFPFFPMATIGYLFFVVGIIDYFGGAGIVAALVLGIVIGNGASLKRWLGLQGYFVLSQRVRQFGTEVAFLTRAFFLFSMGLLVSISSSDIPYVLAGLMAAGGVFLTRVGVVRLFIESTGSPKRLELPLSSLHARGLTSAVLILLPVSLSAFPNLDYRPLIEAAMTTIMVTTAVMSFGVWLYERDFRYQKLMEIRKRGGAATLLKGHVQDVYAAALVTPSESYVKGMGPAPDYSGRPPLPVLDEKK